MWAGAGDHQILRLDPPFSLAKGLSRTFRALEVHASGECFLDAILATHCEPPYTNLATAKPPIQDWLL